MNAPEAITTKNTVGRPMTWRGVAAVVALCGLGWGASLWLGAGRAVAESDASTAARWQPAGWDSVDSALLLPADRLAVPVPVRRGASFGLLMQQVGLRDGPIREAAKPHHDFRVVRADRELQVLFQDGADAPVGVRYQLDADRTLVVMAEPVEAAAGDEGVASVTWLPHVETVPYAKTLERLELTLRSSLWQAGLDAGLRPDDLSRIAKVFEYELDFNTELQPGAEVVLVGERLRADDRKPKLGELYAVRLRNGKEVFEGFRWETEDIEGEPTAAWFYADGSPMQKAFLRSPLGFSRITSGFNPRRYHPVLKQRRPHNGVDFGAPTGTPVRVVADGTVTTAGWTGGHGLYVKVRHDETYETSYSHLSRLHVRKGQKIGQGTLIGRVGATGLATGAHLHYQMWRNGSYVDPLQHDLPSVQPMEGEVLENFGPVVGHWQPILDGDAALYPYVPEAPVSPDTDEAQELGLALVEEGTDTEAHNDDAVGADAAGEADADQPLAAHGEAEEE